MIGTRNNGRNSPPRTIDADTPASVRQLLLGGTGGRKEHVPLRRKDSQVIGNVQEDLNDPPKADLPPDQTVSEVTDPPVHTESTSSSNIIVNAESLKCAIENNLCCKTCSLRCQADFIQNFLAHCAGKENGNHVRGFSKSFVRTRGKNKKTTYVSEGLDVNFKSHGLATSASITCQHDNQRFRHVASIHPESSVKEWTKKGSKTERATNSAHYALNLKAVIATMLMDITPI